MTALALVVVLVAATVWPVVGPIGTAAAANHSTITVAPPGQDADFDEIQAAIDAASPGATIQVGPGEYDEGERKGMITIDKPGLTIRGDPGGPARGPGPDAPFLNDTSFNLTAAANGTTIVGFSGTTGTHGASVRARVGSINTPSVHLEDVTVRQSRLWSVFVDVDAQGGRSTVSGIEITGNVVGEDDASFDGVSVGGTNPHIASEYAYTDIHIADNRILGSASIGQTAPATFANVSIEDNVLSSIVVRSNTANETVDGLAIQRNTVASFEDPHEGIDLALDGSNSSYRDIRVEDNTLELGGHVPYGVRLYLEDDGATTYDVAIEENRINDSQFDGVVVIREDTSESDEKLSITGTIVGNEIRNAGGSAIRFLGDPEPTRSTNPFTVRENVLSRNRYGITNNVSGEVVDARDNYWGGADGPASRGGKTLADPVTGTLATGSGGAVSPSPADDGTANVRFDPFYPVPPGASAAPTFSVRIDRSEGPVSEGEPLTVQATIENTGGLESSEMVRLLANGTQRDARAVRLSPGQETTLELSWDTGAGDAGDYTATIESLDDSDSIGVTVLADSSPNVDFDVSIDATNEPVQVGETLTVDATVQNTGTRAGSQSVSLAAGGTQRDAKSVTLDPAESATVTLSWATGSGDAGTYTATLASEDDAASVGVTVVPPGDQLTACAVIDRPGRYVLAGSITNASTDACIEIVASDVRLDGAGGTLDGDDGSSGSVGVLVDGAEPIENVTVEDLVLRGWGSGLVVGDEFGTGVEGASIEAVTAAENDEGIRLENASATTVRGGSVRSSDDRGVSIVAGSNVTVEDARIRDNGDGVLVGVGAADVRLGNNTVEDHGGIGLDIAGTNVTVRGNTLQRNRDGILVRRWGTASVSLADNEVGNSTHAGIHLRGSGVDLESNTLRDNRDGVLLAGAGGNAFANTTIVDSAGWAVASGPGAAEGSGGGGENTFSDLDLGYPSATLSFGLRDVSVRPATTSATPVPPPGMTDIGVTLNATNTTASGYLDLTVTYDDAAVSPVDESTLSIWRHDGDWTEVGGTVDPGENTVSMNLTVFSVVAPLGNLSTEPGSPPTARFDLDPVDALVGEAVSLDASNSTDPDGDIVEYRWDVHANGTVNFNTSSPTVSAIFTEAGTLDIRLTVVDANGLTDSTTASIKVTDATPPTANFSYGPTPVYVGELVTFDATESADLGSSIAEYRWDFNGSGAVDATTTSPTTTVRIGEAGTFNVTLTVVDEAGNNDTTTRSLVARAGGPTARFNHSPASPGPGEPVTFDASSASDPTGDIVEYRWDFNDSGSLDLATNSPTATVAFAEDGRYTVSLIVVDEHGFEGTINATVVVGDVSPPAANFSYGPTPVYVGEILTFDASGSTDGGGAIAEYRWDFNGSGAVDATTTTPTTTVRIGEAGTFNVTLTVVDEAGNTDTVARSLVARAGAPTADFSHSPDSPGPGEPVTFDASSASDPTGDIVEYRWDFNDSGSLDLATSSPTSTVTFTDDGRYNVSLTVVDEHGFEGSINATVVVGDVSPPTANFSYGPTPVYVGEILTFDASSSVDVGGTIVEYRWDFNSSGEIDSTTASPSTTVRIGEAGTYDVTLTVVDEAGNTDTVSRPLVAMAGGPTAGFTHSPISPGPGEPVTVDAASTTDPTNDIVSYAWDFNGSGTVDLRSNSPTATVRFGTPGAYNVTLTVTDDDGNADVHNRTVVVGGTPPSAAFVASSATAFENETVLLDATASSDPDGRLVSYAWDLDDDGEVDGNTTGPVTAVKFTEPGNYTVNLTVTDDHGLTDSTTRRLTILDRTPPTVELTGVNDGGSAYASPAGQTIHTDGPVGFQLAANGTPGTAAGAGVVLYSASANFVHRIEAVYGSGDTWTATANLSAIPDDGTYNVVVTATDPSGNSNASLSNVTVDLDRTSPGLIGTVSRLDADTGRVRVESDEPLADPPTVVVEKPNGTVETVTAAATGAGAWNATFSLDESNGRYEVAVTGTDRAGNEALVNASTVVEQVETTNNTATVVIRPSGLFVTFTTDEEVSDTVIMTQSNAPLAPLSPNQAGMNFLDATLGEVLVGNLSHAVLGIPVTPSALPPGVEATDVMISYYDEQSDTWRTRATTIETRTVDGNTDEYWVANVTHFSTYGAVATDTVAPSLDAASPSGALPQGTTNHTIRFEYSDAISGVDVGAVVVHFDGNNVTDGAATSITSQYATYDATGLDVGSHTASVTVHDVAGNTATYETTFTVQEPDDGEGSDSSGGAGNGDGSAGGARSSVRAPRDDGPEPARAALTDDDPNRPGLQVSVEDSPVQALSFEDEDLEDSGEVTVTERGTAPGTVGSVFGEENVVTSVDIEVPAAAEDTAATIRFHLDESAIGDRNPDSLLVVRVVEGDNQRLPTDVEQGPNGGAVVEADTPGFSTFAIVAVEDRATGEGATQTERSTSETEAPTTTVGAGATTPGATATRTTAPGGQDGFGPLIGLVSIFVAGLYACRRRR